MNEEQVTEVIDHDFDLDKPVDDSPSVDDVLQGYAELKQEVVKIKELLEERFEQDLDDEVTEVVIEDSELDLLTSEEYLSYIHEQESYQTILLIVLIGCFLGYVAIKGLFENWRAKSL